MKVVVYGGDKIIIRQRVKILDDEGNLIKAPIIEVREKRRGNESLKNVVARAEKLILERIKNIRPEEKHHEPLHL